MSDYVLRDDVVEAIKWYNNLQDVIEFCHPYKVQVDLGIDVEGRWFLEIMRGEHSIEWPQLMREQWLVKDKDGNLSVVDWSNFDGLYREIE